jgi:hypothetical protein
MLVQLGLDSAKCGEQVAMLDAPGAMVCEPALVIAVVVLVVFVVFVVSVSHVVLALMVVNVFGVSSCC